MDSKEVINSNNVGRFCGSFSKQLSINDFISEDGFSNKSYISTPRQYISICGVANTAAGFTDQHSGGMCEYSSLYFSTTSWFDFWNAKGSMVVPVGTERPPSIK